MTVVELPIFKTTSARWKSDVTLDKVVYSVQVHWNDREESWYLSLFDNQGNPLACGIKLVCGIDLLKKHKFLPGVPSGHFYVADLNMDLATAVVDWDGLGTRFLLTYVSFADEV